MGINMKVTNITEYKEKKVMNTPQDYLTQPFTNLINETDYQEKLGIMKILVGAMNQGKTFTMANVLIPELASKGVEIITVTVPQKCIIDLDDFAMPAQKAGLQIAETVKDALKYAKRGIKVLLITNHSDLTRSNDSKKWLEYLKKTDRLFAVFVDETHTWMISSYLNYQDVSGNVPVKYEAKLFKWCSELAKRTPHTYGLTATPNKEQVGKIEVKGMQFEVINEIPDKKLLLPHQAYLRNVTFFDADFVNNSFEILDLYEEAIVNLYNSEIKKAMLTVSGRKGCKSKADIEYVLSNTLTILQSSTDVNYNDYVVALMTQDKKVSGAYAIDGSFMKLDEDEIKEKLNDLNDPLRILIVVEKGKVGMNVRTIKTEFNWRTTDKKDKSKEPLVEISNQTQGRALRINPPMPLDEFVKKYGYSLEGFIKTLPEDEYQDLLEANSIDLYLPDNDMNRKSIEVFRDVYVNDIQQAKIYYENVRKDTK